MSDKINELVPGQPMTDEQRAALAKSNAEATAEAHRLAAEARAREGSPDKLQNEIQGSILEKLKQLPPEPKE